MSLHKIRLCSLLGGILLSSSLIAEPNTTTAADLIQLEFEDLMDLDIEVQSAGKHSTRALDLVYAGHVLTAHEIRKSGVRNIPDALRMVPGVSVSQISNSEWAVGIRGQGGRYSRFVLIMVDGRSAYNVAFSGVNWDELNISIDHIERIEVIHGPNASAWGANAVNGIINIITHKPTPNTRNELAIWGGDASNAGGAANGHFKLSEQWSANWAAHNQKSEGLKGKYPGVQEGEQQDWRLSFQVGKKTSTLISADYFRVSQTPRLGYINTESFSQVSELLEEDKAGWALQAKQSFKISDEQKVQLRVSADKTDRDASIYQWDSQNLQLDAEWGATLSNANLALGFNGRINESEIALQPQVSFEINPKTRKVEQYGVFGSYQLDINPKWQITLASRWDYNTLSGGNHQPSLRGLWRASESTRLWFAVSEATTSPSRTLADIDNAGQTIIPPSGPEQPLPILIVVDGYAEEQEETRLRSVELGYRKTFENFSVDFSLFNFDYDNDITYVSSQNAEIITDENNIPRYVRQSINLANAASLSTYGGEFTVRGQLTSAWSSQIGISHIDNSDSGNLQQLSVVWTNTFDITPNVNLFVGGRYKDGVSESVARQQGLIDVYNEIEDYVLFDANLLIKLGNKANLEICGRNLGSKHVEGGREELRTEVMQVTPYGQIKLRFQF